MKLHTSTLAFALVFAVTGLCVTSIVWTHGNLSAHAPADRTLQVRMQGDAAARARATLQVVKTVCAADAIHWTEPDAAQTDIHCPLAQPLQEPAQRRFTHLDFRFDTAPVGCDKAGTWVTVAGRAVLRHTGCGRGDGLVPSTALTTVNPGPANREWTAVVQSRPLPAGMH